MKGLSRSTQWLAGLAACVLAGRAGVYLCDHGSPFGRTAVVAVTGAGSEDHSGIGPGSRTTSKVCIPQASAGAVSCLEQLAVEFRAAVESGDTRAVSECRRRLWEAGDGSVQVLAPLLNCGERRTELESARTLVQIGTAESLACVLAKVLAMDRGDGAYEQWIKVLTNCKSPALIQLVAGRLVAETSPEIRKRSADLLSMCRGPAAVETLTGLAGESNDAFVRRTSLQYLATRQDPAEVPVLQALARSEDRSISAAAVAGLGGVGNDTACRFLAAEINQDTYLGPQCAGVLAQVRSPYAQEALIALATDPASSADTQTAAVLALSTYRSERARRVLASLAPDPVIGSVAVRSEKIVGEDLAKHVSAVGDTQQNTRIEECF